MLYTLSEAQYDYAELARILANLTEQDALVLWQDGVLQAVKYPDLFAKIPHVFALTNDVNARAIKITIPTISLAEFVTLSEHYFPHLSL